MREFKIVFYLLFGCAWVTFANGSTTIAGSPVFDAFMPEDYSGSRSTWSVTAAPQGIRYVGGDDVYRYDGYDFETISLPGLSLIRGLLYEQQTQTLWVGANEDLGYIDCSARPFVYKSIKQNLPASYKHSETWAIHSVGSSIVFAQKDGLVIREASGDYEFVHLETNRRLITHLCNQRLFIQQRGVGLLEFDPDTNAVSPVSSLELFRTDALLLFTSWMMEGFWQFFRLPESIFLMVYHSIRFLGNLTIQLTAVC